LRAGAAKVSKTATIWRTNAAPNASFSQRRIASRWSGRRWSIAAAASGVSACLDAPPIGIVRAPHWPPPDLDRLARRARQRRNLAIKRRHLRPSNAARRQDLSTWRELSAATPQGYELSRKGLE
jgi:hypothetical protein